MKKVIVWAGILFQFLMLTGYVGADTLYLSNGSTLKGQVLFKDDEDVVIKTDMGKLRIKSEKVTNITYDSQDYIEQKAKPDTRQEEEVQEPVRLQARQETDQRLAFKYHNTGIYGHIGTAKLELGTVNRFIDYLNDSFGISPKIEHFSEATSICIGLKTLISRNLYLIGQFENISKTDTFIAHGPGVIGGNSSLGVECQSYGLGLSMEMPPENGSLALGLDFGLAYYIGKLHYDFDLGYYGRESDSFKGSNPGVFFNLVCNWYTTSQKDRGISGVLGYRIAKIDRVTSDSGQQVYYDGNTSFDLDFSGTLYGLRLFYYFK